MPELDLLTVFSIVGTVLGIILSLIPLIKDRSKRSLSYKKQIITEPKFKKSDGALKKIYQSNKRKSVCLAVIKVLNSGNQPITESDYSEGKPITLSFGKNAKVLFSEIANTKPKNFQPTLRYSDDKSVELLPVLFNPKESFTIKALVHNFDSISFNCRITGITQVSESVSKLARFWKEILLSVTIIISFTGILTLQPMLSYFLLWQISIVSFLLSSTFGLVTSIIWGIRLSKMYYDRRRDA
jgi:hypothetical protein